MIEMVLKLAAASAPSWHPAAATPVERRRHRGAARAEGFCAEALAGSGFRELQAAGGRIEINNARVQQRDTIAVANGALGLSPAGRLDGQLRLTVANLEKFLPTLGLDQMLSQEQASPKLNNAFGALDRIMPGLGNVARKNAAPDDRRQRQHDGSAGRARRQARGGAAASLRRRHGVARAAEDRRDAAAVLN